MTDASAGWPEGAREAAMRAMHAADNYNPDTWERMAEQLWRPKYGPFTDAALAALAPFLTAALAAQAGAMRDIARIEVAADMRSQAEGLGGTWMATMQMLADRLLGGHAMDALAAALAEARDQGRLEGATAGADELDEAEARGRKAGLREAAKAARAVILEWQHYEDDTTALPALLAAERAAGVREGMEKAAAMIGCGCVQAPEVAALPPNSAQRWELCGQPNCCAIEAAAILAASDPPA